MGTTDVIYLVLFFVCLAISAFFSSAEVAFISLQKLRLRHLAETQGGAARAVAAMVEKPEHLLSTVLLGNNLVNTAAAALATVVAASVLPEGDKGWAVLAATGGVTVLLLVFGEVLPKTIAARHGLRLAIFYAPFMLILVRVLSPIAAVLAWIAVKFARLVGVPPAPQALTSEAEIRTAVSVGVLEGTLKESKADMLEGVFRFADRHVSDVMLQRPEISWVEKGTVLRDFLSIYAQAPYSRFPVYEDTIDNVVGVLWIKDVLMAQAKGALKEDSPVDGLVRKAYFVPETKHVAALFAELQESGGHIAIVVDEFGGIAGLVTMEKLLEEIVGELRDELEKTRKSFEAVGENAFQVDGGMRVEEANAELQLGIPEGDYETVAGFVLNVLARIPKEGEQLRHGGLKMVITEVKGVKIERILVTKE